MFWPPSWPSCMTNTLQDSKETRRSFSQIRYLCCPCLLSMGKLILINLVRSLLKSNVSVPYVTYDTVLPRVKRKVSYFLFLLLWKNAQTKVSWRRKREFWLTIQDTVLHGEEVQNATEIEATDCIHYLERRATHAFLHFVWFRISI